jgi:hypothetical protein
MKVPCSWSRPLWAVVAMGMALAIWEGYQQAQPPQPDQPVTTTVTPTTPPPYQPESDVDRFLRHAHALGIQDHRVAAG